MRAYWILPNRDQKDEISASDGETILPLRQILDPTLLPEGFSHGVPTEILEKCGPKELSEILFAQRFPNWCGNQQLFCVSTPAGLDSSGRVVHLGLLFILEPDERPRFDLPYSSLSKEDKPYASALIRRMPSAGRGDTWAQSVRELSELPHARRPATNVALDRSVARFDSLYVIGPGGLTKKAAHRRRWHITAAIVLLCLLVAAGVSLCMQVKRSPVALRHGEEPSRPAVQTGVVTWRFN